MVSCTIRSDRDQEMRNCAEAVAPLGPWPQRGCLWFWEFVQWLVYHWFWFCCCFLRKHFLIFVICLARNLIVSYGLRWFLKQLRAVGVLAVLLGAIRVQRFYLKAVEHSAPATSWLLTKPCILCWQNIHFADAGWGCLSTTLQRIMVLNDPNSLLFFMRRDHPLKAARKAKP